MQHKNWVQARIAQAGKLDSPRPLLKHRLTVSNGAQSSETVDPVSAATCHMRAPSRCIFRSFARAHSEMAMISSCGKMVPLSVFSSEMTFVGALYRAGSQ